MRLFEAILEANNRAVAGDATASLHQSDWAAELPIAALTCIDVRLNPLIPEVLGIAEENFIWLRNAGNIITGPLSSTMRSLALACAVKGGKEIAIIGHTDCQVCKTSTMQLLDKFKALGIERHVLPDNVNEFFGMFSSERQNVIKACEIVRASPLIGPKIPVHGLLLDITTGRVEWVVNGYQTWGATGATWNEVVKSAGETVDRLKTLADFKIGEMSFPQTKIGETVTHAADWLERKIEKLEVKPTEIPPTATNIAEGIVQAAEKHWPKPAPHVGRVPKPPPRIPAPPPIRSRTIPPRSK